MLQISLIIILYIIFNEYMLKLNSSYGKSFLRQPSNQQFERGRGATTDRFIPPSDGEPIQPWRKEDGRYKRDSYDYKRSNAPSDFTLDYPPASENRSKEQGYSYGYKNARNNEDLGVRKDQLGRRQKSYGEPQEYSEQNYKEISPRTVNNRSYAPSSSTYQPLSQSIQNYDHQDAKSQRYAKYTPRTPPNEQLYSFEKPDNPMKHSKRNQEVRSRMQREQEPYGLRQMAKPSYELQRQTYENQSKGNNIYNDYRQDQPEEYRDEYPSYKMNRKGNEDGPQSGENGVLRFDRAGLNQRKQAIKKTIQNTPEKGYKGRFQPGSAEKQKSLIEKSQQLQQKLKKLNSQYPISGEQRPSPQGYTGQVTRNSYAQRGQQSSRYQQTYTANTTHIPNRSTTPLRGSFRNINISHYQKQSNRPSQQSQQNYQDWDLKKDFPSKGQAIEKITKLNEQINERIQSIISNYAKK